MSENITLLSGQKKDDDNGSLRRRSFGSFSRFGPDVETSGVKPSGDSISNIPLVLEGCAVQLNSLLHNIPPYTSI